MEVSQSIIFEILLFKDACLLGLLLTFLYDVIRIFRRIVIHGEIWIAIEDAIYWLLAGVMLFALLYNKNDGTFRMYVFIGAALGTGLYYLLIGRHFMRLASKKIYQIKKQLKKAKKAVRMRLEKHRKN